MRIKSLYLIVIATLLLGAGSDVLAETPLKARGYQCQKLKQLVADKERIYLKGLLGSKSSVHASASSCHYLHEVAIKSAWRTKDVRSCVVGYRCLSVFQIRGRIGGDRD